MRLWLLILALFPLFVSGQFGNPRWVTPAGVIPPPPPPGGTVNLTFTAINPLTDFARPGGNEQWNENSGSQIVSGAQTPQNDYRRFSWADCESSTSQGDYSKLWTNGSQPGGIGKFRRRVMNAIDQGRTFSFGIMQFYPEVCSAGGFNDYYFYDGFCGTYPQYVHNLMQASGLPDFNDGTSWIPNYNHTQWLARWQALLVAINNWIDTATYTPSIGPKSGQLVEFEDVISYVDLRGFGSYGEWHSCCIGNGYDNVANWPSGRYGTVATMKQIIDIGANSFPNFPVVIIINVLDGDRFNNTKIPAEVGIYALTKTNTFGRIGLRRDQWGDNASYYSQILQDNTMTFGGVRADTAVLSTYKYNYFLGEPPGYNNNGSTLRNGVFMGWLPEQATILRAYSVGNGNYGGNAPTNQSSRDSILKAYRIMGARIFPDGGTMTQTLQVGASFNVTVNWRNSGLATEHRDWTTTYELRNSGGSTVATFTSAFNVEKFNPNSTSVATSDNFVVGAIAAGSGYSLYVKIIDPTNYKSPYPLGITGRDVDGAYLVRSNITIIPAS